MESFDMDQCLRNCDLEYRQKTHRVVSMFYECVNRMPGRMVVHRTNIDMIREVFMPAGELIPVFTLTGSSVRMPTTYGSDIDIRFTGTNVQVLLDRLTELRTRTRLSYHWPKNVKNLLTLKNIGMSLDVLIVNDFSVLRPFTLRDGITLEEREILDMFNGDMYNAKERIPYHADKALAIDGLYNIGLGSELGRALVVYLKMLDCKIPTCLTVVIAAFVVASVPQEHLTKLCMGFDIAMEIASQFAYRFVFNFKDESHIQWGFATMWKEFCKQHLKPFRNEMVVDPLRALLPNHYQHERVKASGAWRWLRENYPIRGFDCPAPMLDAPRVLMPNMIRTLADFIIVSSTFPERDLRMYSTYYGGLWDASRAFWSGHRCNAALANFMRIDCYLYEVVVAALEEVVTIATV